jgi:formate dehydrogenase
VPALAGSWRHEGGGFSYVPLKVARAVSWMHLRRQDLRPGPVREINMSTLGGALTDPALAPPVRALVCWNANPAAVAPDRARVLEGLRRDDLFCVVLEQFMTDTARHADYVLPATTFLEREDFPSAFLTFHTAQFVQWTDAVVEPRGEARQEWEIIEQIAERVGVTPAPAPPARWFGKLGVKFAPDRLLDLLLRTGPKGDLFGLRRGGLSIAKLRENPHGIVLAPEQPVGVLKRKVFHRDKRVHLDPPQIAREVAALASINGGDASYPMRLIGLRELRSHNSWMHNVEKLMAADRSHSARIHPDDADGHGIEDGAPCRVVSPHGQIELPAKVTDEIMPGTVAIPHGWGHRGEWRRATASGGANVNALASSEPEDLERLAGMALLNGIPIRLEAVTIEADVADLAGEREPEPVA